MVQKASQDLKRNTTAIPRRTLKFWNETLIVIFVENLSIVSSMSSFEFSRSLRLTTPDCFYQSLSVSRAFAELTKDY